MISLSRPFKEDRRALSLKLLRPSPPGDRWWDGLGIVSARLSALSRAPQHFRTSETQATCCNGAVHPQEFSQVDVEH